MGSISGASGCTSTGLLVLFPLNLRQSSPKNPKGQGLGAPGEPRKPWLSCAIRTGGCAEQWLEGDCRHLGLALLSLRLE